MKPSGTENGENSGLVQRLQLVEMQNRRQQETIGSLKNRVAAEAKILKRIKINEVGSTREKEKQESGRKEVTEEERKGVEMEVDEVEGSDRGSSQEPMFKGGQFFQSGGSTRKREEKRERTLILKGMVSPTESSVRKVLQSFQISQGGEIQEVVSKKIGNQDWVFVTFSSVEEMENSFRNKYKLRGSNLFIQKDMSLEERVRERERRAAKKVVYKESYQKQNLARSPSFFPSTSLPVSMAGPSPNGWQQFPNGWHPWMLPGLNPWLASNSFGLRQ